MLDVRNRFCSTYLGPAESLYLNEAGRRVVFAADEPSRIIVTGPGDPEFRVEEWPQGGALVAEGEVQVFACFGPPCRIATDQFVEASGRRTGVAGWIAAGSYVEKADGEPLRRVTPFPIPFWRGYEATGHVFEVPSPQVFKYEDIHATEMEGRAAWGFQADAETAPYRVLNTLPNILAMSATDTTARGTTYRAHLGVARFRVELRPGCIGLRVSKEYDRFQGRQRARVWVDGQFVGVWSAYEEDRSNRAFYSEFSVPPECLTGKSEVEIAIDPPSGSPLWTWEYYTVWALINY